MEPNSQRAGAVDDLERPLEPLTPPPPAGQTVTVDDSLLEVANALDGVAEAIMMFAREVRLSRELVSVMLERDRT